MPGNGIAKSYLILIVVLFSGFPSGSAVKNLPANVGDVGLIPGLERSLEKEMATHANTFVWEIPWTEELGGLQSMGSQRVRHDLATEHEHMLFSSYKIITFHKYYQKREIL